MKTRWARLTTALSLCTLFSIFLMAAQPADALWRPDANECKFLHVINDYRADYGLRPLLLSRSLSMAADYHSEYMASTDDVDHTLSGGSSWSANILAWGYPAGYGMGENVLAGRQCAGGALNLWISSPPHRANMLNPSWVAIGIGREYNPDGYYKFYWTTTFGTVRHRTISC